MSYRVEVSKRKKKMKKQTSVMPPNMVLTEKHKISFKRSLEVKQGHCPFGKVEGHGRTQQNTCVSGKMSKVLHNGLHIMVSRPPMQHHFVCWYLQCWNSLGVGERQHFLWVSCVLGIAAVKDSKAHFLLHLSNIVRNTTSVIKKYFLSRLHNPLFHLIIISLCLW